MSREIQNNKLCPLKQPPQRNSLRKEHSLLCKKLLTFSASLSILAFNMYPALAAANPSPPYIRTGMAQGFAYFGPKQIQWDRCGEGAGIGLTNQCILAVGSTGEKMGYVVRYPKEAPTRFDTFRFSAEVRCPSSIRFLLFFQNLKSGQTSMLTLSGSDIAVTEGGQQWLYVPRQHYGSDVRYKDCRLYKILVEYEVPNWRDTTRLYDVPVTFIDPTGKPIEVHAQSLCLQCMGEEAYRQDPSMSPQPNR